MSFPLINVPRIEIIKDSQGIPMDGRGLLPIEVFILTYLPHCLKNRKGQFMRIPHSHREGYYVMEHPELYPSMIWVAPRGFAKSTTVCLFGTLYDALVTKRWGEQVILGASDGLAEKWLRKIKWELSSNEKLIRDFGGGGPLSTDGLKDGIWKSDEIMLTNGERIFCSGAGGTIRGEHPPCIRADDLEKDDQAKSTIRIEAMEEWMRSAILPMQREEGCVIYWTGTLLQQDTVLQKAFEGKDEWDDSWLRLGHPAIWTQEAAERHKKVSAWWPYEFGDPIWPDAFSLEFLEKKRKQIGSMAFMAEYMNDPQAAKNPVFYKNWMRYYERDSELPKYMRKIITIDAAAETKEVDDETSIEVLGLDTTPGRRIPKVFVLDVIKGHFSEGDICRKTYDLHEYWHVQYIKGEGTAFQSWLKNALDREGRDRGYRLDVKMVKPKHDKVTRARGVVPMHERGEVFFRKDDPNQDELIKQMIAFPKHTKRDDMVDSHTQGCDEFLEAWKEVDNQNDNSNVPDLAAPMIGY